MYFCALILWKEIETIGPKFIDAEERERERIEGMRACTIRARTYFIFKCAGAREYFLYNNEIRMVDREGSWVNLGTNEYKLEQKRDHSTAQKLRRERCFLKSIMGAVYNRTVSF